MLIDSDHDLGLLAYPIAQTDVVRVTERKALSIPSNRQTPMFVQLNARQDVDVCELRPTSYALPLLSFIIGIILFIVLPSLGYDSFVLPIPAFFSGIGLLFLALYQLITFEFDRKHRKLTVKKRRIFTTCCPTVTEIPFHAIHSVQLSVSAPENASGLRTAVMLVVNEDDLDIISGTEPEMRRFVESWSSYISTLDRRQLSARR